MKNLFRPTIDYQNSFHLEYYVKDKNNEALSGNTLSKKEQRELKIIGKSKIAYDGTLIRIYIDKKYNLWYYSPSLFSGYFNIDEDDRNRAYKSTIRYFQTPGWCKIEGVYKLIKDYSVLEIKQALALYIIHTSGGITNKYEDILLAILNQYKDFLDGEDKGTIEVKRSVK